MRGVTKFKTLRGFAGHRVGGSAKFLSKWKVNGVCPEGQKGCTGSLETWMHTKDLPSAVYRHQFPTIVIRDDKNDKSKKVKHVWSKNYVCHETESVLEGQYFRDKETGIRKHEPERCGACKLVEWCYQQSIAFEETRKTKKPKGLNFTTPLFHFEGDDPSETITLHVGGVCNLFNKDLSDVQKEEMREAKIYAKNAWKENCWAKCQYAMKVVDNASPDDGVQIAVEASSLGDKVKDVLNTELDNDNDIQKSPYCIRWMYFEKETDLNKKYKAVALRKMRPSTRILNMIRGEAPELPEDLSVPFNQAALRATLERHCLLPKGIVPWDELFPSKEQTEAWAKEDAEEERAAKKLEAEAETEEPKEEDEESEDDAEEEKESEDDEELFECNNDQCKKPVKATDKVCPHCGFVYEVDGGEEPAPEPEKPKMRSRSEAAIKPAGGGGSTKKKRAEPEEDAGEEDGIPFVRDETLRGIGRV